MCDLKYTRGGEYHFIDRELLRGPPMAERPAMGLHPPPGPRLVGARAAPVHVGAGLSHHRRGPRPKYPRNMIGTSRKESKQTDSIRENEISERMQASVFRSKEDYTNELGQPTGIRVKKVPDVAELKRLREYHFSVRKIAEHFGVKSATVYRWLNEYDLPKDVAGNTL